MDIIAIAFINTFSKIKKQKILAINREMAVIIMD